jgi:hypothetical protein
MTPPNSDAASRSDCACGAPLVVCEKCGEDRCLNCDPYSDDDCGAASVWERGDAFRVDGGCWCPGERTLTQMRLTGHDAACTAARKGWEQNRRHLSQIAQRREEERALGAALLAEHRRHERA